MTDYKTPKSISYSYLIDWNRCGWYYYLKDVLRLPAFTGSEDTVFGTIIHDKVQSLLSGKLTREEAIKSFSRTWTTFCKLYKKTFKKQDVVEEWLESGVKILTNIQEEFTKEFKEYEVLSVEDEVNEQLDNHPQSFKGFLDLVIAVKNGPIIIIDFKKTSTAYWFTRYKDKYKDYQLTLYKHFLSRKLDVPEESIKTYFCLLETTMNKGSQINLTYISSEKKKVENAKAWLNESLDAINGNRYYKNRTACEMYGKKCPFFNTPHCTK